MMLITADEREPTKKGWGKKRKLHFENKANTFVEY